MKPIIFVGLLTVASGLAVLVLKGQDAFFDAALANGPLLAHILPLVAASIAIVGMAQVLTPRDEVSRWLGQGSGAKGLLLATTMGALTFGGPMTSFPMVAILAVSGADIGAVVAYLTAWALLGVNRIVVWEIPALGSDFALVRMLASLPVPILAGLIARLLERFSPVRFKAFEDHGA